MHIPMSSPDLTEAEIAAVNAVLRTPQLSMGPRIDEFERAVADFLGARHAVGVSSGTTGLHLAVIAAGIEQGDEVITTPFSFVASANCILYERAQPVFVDIDPQTLNIDPARIEAAVTPRTRAILTVDVFGQPADYDPIRQIAGRHGLTIIEDACEAIGAEYQDRKAGTLGDVAVFGFYPNKQMTTAEGGVIVTDRQDWNTLFRSLRNQGRDESGTWLNHVRLGYNYRLNELSAALGLAQMKRIQELLDRRARVAHMYNERLRGVEGVSVPYVAATTTKMSWFVYVIRLAPEIDRDAVMAHLHTQGIACRPYFTPIHLQPFYVDKFGYSPGDFPITEAVSASTLALPFHNHLDEATVDLICQNLRQMLS
ncbi:MAG: DegT/DnrJ/EryC1/StrS family aminotransferase [Chloroflexota bacterium]